MIIKNNNITFTPDEFHLEIIKIIDKRIEKNAKHLEMSPDTKSFSNFMTNEVNHIKTSLAVTEEKVSNINKTQEKINAKLDKALECKADKEVVDDMGKAVVNLRLWQKLVIGFFIAFQALTIPAYLYIFNNLKDQVDKVYNILYEADDITFDI